MTGRRRLPPLNPLRNFEAVARHQSFVKAAAELNVTSPAVSRQVAVLEDYLGVALFNRAGNTLLLSGAGRRLLPPVTTALNLIDEGARQLRRPPSDPVIVCTYLPLAMKWLVPRLSSFYENFPDIEINITSAVRPQDYDYSEIDIGIVFGHKPSPDLEAALVLPDLVVPVCNPALHTGAYPLPPMANLRHHTLLHSRYRQRDWPDWLRLMRLGVCAAEVF